MTSRPVTSTPGTPVPATPATTHTVAADRPHLPPVADSKAATSSRSRRKAPLAWLPWLLLGLLALTLLAAALLARAAGNDGGTPDRASSAASTGNDADAQSGSGGSGGSGESAALSAGGQDLLAQKTGVGSLEGQQASGTAKVESVVADEGFWVGSSATERVFVFLTPEARKSAGESGFQVEAGQTVSLEGTVKASSAEFARTAGVTDAEGSRQLVEQGGYVEATEVRLAQ